MNKLAGDLYALAYKPWLESGFDHGFCGVSLTGTDQLCTLLVEKTACTLVRAKQVHGDGILDCRLSDALSSYGVAAEKDSLPPYSSFSDADAILLSREAPSQLKPVLAVVATADCLPLIVRCEGQVALIHAGWRGLACGVITRTLDRIRTELKGEEKVLEVLVGPAAGRQSYEVGEEVFSAIGQSACSETHAGKRCLHLAETARNQIESFWSFGPVHVHSADICTMTDLRYHSYRRDGQGAGRNLAFVTLE